MKHKGLEAFIEKIDAEDSKDSKPNNTISDTAKAMKLELEEGLKEIDALDPIE